MPTRLFCALLLTTATLWAPTADAQQRQGQRRGGSVPAGGVLSSGPLPDLDAFTAAGAPVKLRAVAEGKYTVLVSGCLTCPKFHQTYTAIEAAHADYGPKGVQFYYCLLYTSPSPRDATLSRMPSSA